MFKTQPFRVGAAGRSRTVVSAATAILSLSLGWPIVSLAQSRDFGATSGRLELGSSGRAVLDAAQQELDRGRPLDARRILEAVIEREPSSRLADAARRMLAPIYGRSDPTPAVLSGSGATVERAVESVQERAPALREAATPAGDESANAARSRRGADPRQLRLIMQDYRNHIADRVFFGDASVEIGTRSRPVLAAQAAWFKRHASMLVVIEAHADDQGTRDFNFEIAKRRAEAVRARLVEEGVDAGRIRISVRGRESPVASCSDPACAAQNRRVVTIVGDPALERSLPPISGGKVGQ